MFFSLLFSRSSRGWHLCITSLFFLIGFFRHHAGSIYVYSQNIWCNTNYVRKNNAFTYHVCCQCSIDFIITDVMVSTMQMYGQQIKVKRQQIKINVNIRCFAITVVQENIWIFFMTLIYLCTNLYFVCNFLYVPVIKFSSCSRVLRRTS